MPCGQFTGSDKLRLIARYDGLKLLLQLSNQQWCSRGMENNSGSLLSLTSSSKTIDFMGFFDKRS
jgi:hypothetical protein